MKKIIILLTILFCCNSSILAQKQIEPEEYAIYKIILEKFIITSEYKQIFIVNSTNGSELTDLLSYEKRKLSQLRLDTRKNYNLQNRKSLEVKNNFSIKVKVNLVTLEELMSLFRRYEQHHTWEKTFEEIRIPVQFSRVGFNKNKNQALIEMGTYCGTLCGQGTYFLLTKKNGQWIISQELKTWIS